MRLIFGFSLIELMTVIAIISILTVMAFPSYEHYLQKARFTEILAAVEPFKIAIILALQEGVETTALETGSAGLPDPPPPTRNLASLDVHAGIITAWSTPAAGNASYILTPTTQGPWQISGTCLSLGLCAT